MRLTSPWRSSTGRKCVRVTSRGFANAEILDKSRWWTFHQSYAYEDFIEGIRPVLGGEADGPIRYELLDGIFKRIAKLATDGKEKRFVLIIDEINRGNIAKIFGELITLIEDSGDLARKMPRKLHSPIRGTHSVSPTTFTLSAR